MKKKESPDELILKDKIQKENVSLPEVLSEGNVVALVAGEKQKTPKRKVIKRFVAAAVAACIAVCSFVVYDTAVYAPKLDTKNGNVAYAESYAELSGLMNDYFKSEKFSNIHLYASKGYAMDDAVVAEAENAADLALPESYRAETTASAVLPDTGKAHSETNLRVEGVAEADIVKTDGEYLYAATDGDLHILKADGAAVSEVSVIGLHEEIDAAAGEWCYLSDFYLIGDRLVIELSKSRLASADERLPAGDYFYTDYRSVQGVEIYDISDKTAPSFVREIYFDGYRVSSRVTDGKLVYISANNVNRNRFDAGDYKTFIPAVYEGDEVTYPAAEDIVIAGTDSPDEFLTVAMIDLKDDRSAPETLSVFGAGADIYCTTSTLYVFAANYPYYAWNLAIVDDLVETVSGGTRTSSGETGPSTDIFSFDITGSAPVFKAKGCVKGTLLNTWSLDEYNGYLRLALTNNANYVCVLDGSLNEVGRSEPIAAGEHIESVRFSGDTAYVVTFYQTDPLFIIDLSDAAKPVVKGELKLPGFSRYLHPVGNGLLLGVGEGGDENGLDGSAKLSLFDVSDPYAPKEINSVVMPNAWFNSDYKAFVTVGDGSFLIPFSRWGNVCDTDGSYYYYSDEEIVGVLRVGVENGRLTVLGEYTETSDRIYDTRALFIGDTVYTLSSEYDYEYSQVFIIVNAYNMNTGEKLSSAKF